MLFHDDEHHFVIAAEKCHFVALLSPFNGDEFFPKLIFFAVRQNFDNSLISQHYLIIMIDNLMHLEHLYYLY